MAQADVEMVKIHNETALVFEEVLDLLARMSQGDTPDSSRAQQRLPHWIATVSNALGHCSNAAIGSHVFAMKSNMDLTRTFISNQHMQNFLSSPQYQPCVQAASLWYSDSQCNAQFAAKYKGLPMINGKRTYDPIPASLNELILRYQDKNIPILAEHVRMHQTLGPDSPSLGYWDEGRRCDKSPHMPDAPLDPGSLLGYINKPMPPGFYDGMDSQYERLNATKLFWWIQSRPFLHSPSKTDIGGPGGICNAFFLALRALVDCSKVESDITNGSCQFPSAVVDIARYYVGVFINSLIEHVDASNQLLRETAAERTVAPGTMSSFEEMLTPDASAAEQRFTPLPSPTIGASQPDLDATQNPDHALIGTSDEALESEPIDLTGDLEFERAQTPRLLDPPIQIKQEPKDSAVGGPTNMPTSPRRISSEPQLRGDAVSEVTSMADLLIHIFQGNPVNPADVPFEVRQRLNSRIVSTRANVPASVHSPPSDSPPQAKRLKRAEKAPPKATDNGNVQVKKEKAKPPAKPKAKPAAKSAITSAKPPPSFASATAANSSWMIPAAKDSLWDAIVSPPRGQSTPHENKAGPSTRRSGASRAPTPTDDAMDEEEIEAAPKPARPRRKKNAGK